MGYDKDKVDEMVLLLSLTMFRDAPGYRAWKGHDFEVMDRLCEKGYVLDPKGKPKSGVMTEEGAKLFEKHLELRGKT